MTANVWRWTENNEWWSDHHRCVLSVETACQCLRRDGAELLADTRCGICGGTGYQTGGAVKPATVLALATRPALGPAELSLLAWCERLAQWGVGWRDAETATGRRP